MAVPLFDTRTPLAPLRAEIDAAIAEVLDDERFILGPKVAAFEREFAAYCGAAHAIGVANGTDALTIALRAMGVGPGDEVVVPVVHVLRERRGDPADRRDAGLLRRRPRHVLRHRRDGPRRADAADEGRDRRAPVRQRRAGRRDRGARRPGARGRRAGGRHRRATAAGRARSARPRRSASSRRRTSARFGDGGAITTDDAAIADRVRMLRFHGSRDKVTLRARRLQLAPRRAAGGDPARAAAAPRRLGRRPPRGRGRTTRGRARRARRAAAVAVGGLRARRGTSTSSAHARRRRARRARSTQRGIGQQAYYRTPLHRQPAMRALRAPASSCPATDELAAHAPRDPDERRCSSAEQAAEVVTAPGGAAREPAARLPVSAPSAS